MNGSLPAGGKPGQDMKNKPGIYIGLLLAAVAFASACGRKPDLTGRYRGKNLVLIVIDTLRADRLGCYGYSRPTTPRIDEWSRESLLFTVANVSMGITFPSHTTILTGLYPQSTGILLNWGRVADAQITLAEVLSDAGYRTCAVVSTAVLQSSTNLGQGFEEYRENFQSGDWDPDSPDHYARRKGKAADALRMAGEFVERNRAEPFFLFVNLFDVHFPYLDYEEYQGSFSGETFRETLAEMYSPEAWEKILANPRWLKRINGYDEALAYTDAEIGKFLDRLRVLGLEDDTLVVITSDHGEELFGHCDYGGHGMYLYDGVTRVPLLIRLPDRALRGSFDFSVASVDILPSLLGFLGVRPPEKLDGGSFIPLLRESGQERQYSFALRILENIDRERLPPQYMVRSRDRKLIHSEDSETEFYFLDRDPLEKSNQYLRLSTRERERARAMKARGEDWYQALRLDDHPREGPDPETARDLRALGYLR